MIFPREEALFLQNLGIFPTLRYILLHFAPLRWSYYTTLSQKVQGVFENFFNFFKKIFRFFKKKKKTVRFSLLFSIIFHFCD